MLKNGLILVAALTLAACSGGGGGGSGGGSSTGPDGGGGGGSTGSATVNNLSTAAASSICVKDNNFVISVVPTSSGSCAAAGGAWTTNPSVPTGDRCQVGTLIYTMGGTASASDIEACEAFGTFSPSTNISVSYCDTTGGGYTPPSYAAACSSAGGSMISLASVSGNIDQTTIALEAGNNTITGEAGLSGLSCALQDGSGNPNCDGASPTESPKLFQTTSKIKYGGIDVWTAAIVVPTGVGFSGYTGNQNDTPSFSLVLPVKTQKKILPSMFEAELAIEVFSLYYQP